MITALKIADDMANGDVWKLKTIMGQINKFVVENAEEVLKGTYKWKVLDYEYAQEIIENKILDY